MKRISYKLYKERSYRLWYRSVCASMEEVKRKYRQFKFKLVEKGLRYHTYQCHSAGIEYREVYGRQTFNGQLVLLRVEWRQLVLLSVEWRRRI